MNEKSTIRGLINLEICQSDFYYFYQHEYCYKKTNWKPAPFVREYCRYLQGLDFDPEKNSIGVRLVLLAPRDHLKSSIVEAFCIWKLK